MYICTGVAKCGGRGGNGPADQPLLALGVGGRARDDESLVPQRGSEMTRK